MVYFNLIALHGCHYYKYPVFFFLKIYEWCDGVMRGWRSWFVYGESSEVFKFAWWEENQQEFLEIEVKGCSRNLVFLEGFFENLSEVADVVRVFIHSFKLQ